MRFGTIYRLYQMKKKVIDFLTHNFTLIVATAFTTATLDSLSDKIALGWVFAFLLFFSGIAYSIFKK